MATAPDMAQPTTFGHVADCSNLKNKKRHLSGAFLMQVKVCNCFTFCPLDYIITYYD